MPGDEQRPRAQPHPSSALPHEKTTTFPQLLPAPKPSWHFWVSCHAASSPGAAPAVLNAPDHSQSLGHQHLLQQRNLPMPPGTQKGRRTFHQASVVLFVTSPTTFLCPLLLSTWRIAFPVPLLYFIIQTAGCSICPEADWLHRPDPGHAASPTLLGLPFAWLFHPSLMVPFILMLMYWMFLS